MFLTPKNNFKTNCTGVSRVLVTLAVAVLFSACGTAPSTSAVTVSSPSEIEDKAQVQNLLSQAYDLIMSKDNAGAEKMLNEARRLDPSNPWVALNLGVIYQRQGQNDLARGEYQLALAATDAVPVGKVSKSALRNANAPGDITLSKLAQHNIDYLDEIERKARASAAPEEIVASAVVSRPTVVAPPVVKTPEVPRESQREIQDAFEGWRSAWAARDIETYLSYYQNTFRGNLADRKAWEKNRRENFKVGTGPIELSFQDIDLVVRNEEAIVKAKQNYRSSVLSDVGNKELTFVLTDGKWLIKQERFTPTSKTVIKR